VLASVLQWVRDPGTVLSACARLLRPGGLLAFAVFLEDYLRELAHARRLVGGGDLSVRRFSEDDLHALLDQSGFDVVWCERLRETRCVDGALAVIKYLAGTGATATAAGPGKPGDLHRLCRLYDKIYRGERGTPLTSDILVGIATGRAGN
jgi:SAM-dependent methyltransferase